MRLMDDAFHATAKMGGIKLEDGAAANGVDDATGAVRMTAMAHIKDESKSPMPSPGVSRSGSADTPTSSSIPRSSRKGSQMPPREAVLFSHLADVTEESCNHFQVIPDCLYGSKHLGSTDNDSLDCDCREDWHNGVNMACGEDSDCINRATKMECSATDGNCGGGCQNQRFQRKEYARVSVIKTDKKGFGLRSNAELRAHDFIFEYIGEVINEPTFRRRMLQYDKEGIRHFYFMSLNKSEFVDATKKGNLGRFCNHSCNPNCYVDKWVVGDKLRMGIFALRNIQAGEELVFNYNVDRYGADPQPCYCGEFNCVGFIGGKTQTGQSTKLPPGIVEALGIDGDGWDTAISKKPRKKRPDEDDEEYVNSIQARGMDEDDARKVMAALVQCKEKWIAVKLLERIQLCDDERVIHHVMRMHAYEILKTALNTFIQDHNVVLQVLSVLEKFPRITRNKIQDSKIEDVVQTLVSSEHEEVAAKAQTLLGAWSKLELAYRIRRRKHDPNMPTINSFEDRRGGGQVREEGGIQARRTSPQLIDAPKGPRNNQPQRSQSYMYFNSRPRPRNFQTPLPEGWFLAKDSMGRTYFYDKQENTTWDRPTRPAPEPTVNKAAQEQLEIQNIINRVTKEGSTPKPAAVRTPQGKEATSAVEQRREKYKSVPVEKQMKIYENTIFPYVKHVLDRFKHKLPKDELKRLGKDISKKLINSDFKNNRVDDPTAALTEKQAQKIKKHVKEFLDKAVIKFHGHQERKTLATEKRTATEGDQVLGMPLSNGSHDAVRGQSPSLRDGNMKFAYDEVLSDAELDESPASADRKRKRLDEEGAADSPGLSSLDSRDLKRIKGVDGDEESPVSPPPPPPPPALDEEVTIFGETEEKRALREQEEALMRENEEALRLEDEANRIQAMETAADEMKQEVSPTKKRAEVMSH